MTSQPAARPAEPAPAPREVGPFAIGTRIGDLEITRVLGVGGMGVVYEARDHALLRPVALKAPLFVVHENALRGEAQALAAIHHRGFVTVYQTGRHDGVLFMVMERLYGETLEQRLAITRARGELLPLGEALDRLVDITDALAAAHAVGIAQRDVKPGNVLLCEDRVVLVDFGLFIPEILVDPSNEPGGSAEYIAPEVLLRQVAPGQGPLIDLYALGVVAHELLTGHVPYEADSIGAVLVKHMSAPVPSVLDRRPGIPSDLAALVGELLAKDPHDRPPSAESVLWTLREIRQRSVREAPRTRVLVIDDDPSLGLALARSLESTFPGMHVDRVVDPQRVDLSGRGRPDLVLVDLHMPRRNGVEVCMDLLSLPEADRPRIVAMSAQANAQDIEALEAIGVTRFVPKGETFLAEMSRVVRELRCGGA